MEPTLHVGEIFLIDKRASAMTTLQRGDIVTFDFGDDYVYVKRVIGLPGEMLRLSSNGVEIRQLDGTFDRLREPYLFNNQVVDYGDERYFLVPQGAYFVLGDNRGNSKDSRTFNDPFIRQEHITGKYIYP